MRRRIALISSIAAAGLVLTGGSAAGRAKQVSVGDDFFNPTNLSISKGTRVAFNWIGTDKHNVVLKKGPGARFSSPTTDAQGVNLSHKFKRAGTYKIICTLHDKMKMTIAVG